MNEKRHDNSDSFDSSNSGPRIYRMMRPNEVWFEIVYDGSIYCFASGYTEPGEWTVLSSADAQEELSVQEEIEEIQEGCDGPIEVIPTTTSDLLEATGHSLEQVITKIEASFGE